MKTSHKIVLGLLVVVVVLAVVAAYAGSQYQLRPDVKYCDRIDAIDKELVKTTDHIRATLNAYGGVEDYDLTSLKNIVNEINALSPPANFVKFHETFLDAVKQLYRGASLKDAQQWNEGIRKHAAAVELYNTIVRR